MAAGSAKRSKFYRYRRGDSGTVPTYLGFLLDYNRGVSPLAGSSADRVRVVTAQIDFQRTIDIKPYDILIELVTGKVFVVVSTAQHPGLLRILVAETKAPIPDDFESGIVDQFWTQYRAWQNNSPDGTVRSLTGTQTGYGNATNGPLNIPHLYQVVSGDFDVYSHIKVASADAGLSNYYYGLIKAGLPADTDCVTIGVRAITSNEATEPTTTAKVTFLRQDRVSGVTYSVDGVRWNDGLYAWVRLRRVGVRFATFYSTLQEINRPVRSTDWSEIIGTTTWTSAADVRLGLGFYHNVDDGSPVAFAGEFFRNWQADMR